MEGLPFALAQIILQGFAYVRPILWFQSLIKLIKELPLRFSED